MASHTPHDDSTNTPSRGTRRTSVVGVGVVAGLLVAMLVVIALVNSRKPVINNDSHAIDTSKNTARPENPFGYLGPDACVDCHKDRVHEFKKTRHFLACVEPDPKSMPLGFAEGKNLFQPRGASVRFLMSHDKTEGFLQTAIQRTPNGESRTKSTIDLVYGAGAGTDEVYFTWNNDQISELPMSWLHPTNEWGTAGFDREGTGDFARKTTPRCLECHNTWMDHSPGTTNHYAKATAILGITCEVCHGPGKNHVAFHRTNPDEKKANSIVHPGTLSRERLMDLCSQCHSNTIKHRGRAFQYRPGEPLDNHFKTLTTKHPEDDHVANQTEYLRESKCFQKTDTMTCVTCHNPHEATNLAERGQGGETCRQCHKHEDCREQQSLPVAVRDNCVGCHMPRKNKIQVNFETASVPYLAPVPTWEHRIAVYPVARDEILRAWYQKQSSDDGTNAAELARLTDRLHQHWMNEAETCRSEYRYVAAMDAYRKAEQLHPSAETKARLAEVEQRQQTLERKMTQALHRMKEERYDEALKLLKDVLEIKPEHAIAHGRLGTILSLKGDEEAATKHWNEVSKLDPDDQYGESMLGWRDYLNGRYSEALAAFERAEAIEPYNAKVNHHMALTLMKLERWPEAIRRLNRLLDIDPNHLEGRVALCQLLRINQRSEEALPHALHAVKLTQENNLNLLAALAETYAEISRFDDAEATATKMLGLASLKNPGMVPEIQNRIADWRARKKQSSP